MSTSKTPSRQILDSRRSSALFFPVSSLIISSTGRSGWLGGRDRRVFISHLLVAVWDYEYFFLQRGKIACNAGIETTWHQFWRFTFLVFTNYTNVRFPCSVLG